MSDNHETIGFKATKWVTFLLSMIEVWMHAIMLSNNWMRLNMTLGISVIAPLIIKIDWSRIASYFAIISSRKVFIARALKFKMAASRLATFMTGRKTFQRISRGNREALKESAVSVLSCRGEPELRIFSSRAVF